MYEEDSVFERSYIQKKREIFTICNQELVLFPPPHLPTKKLGCSDSEYRMMPLDTGTTFKTKMHKNISNRIITAGDRKFLFF